MNIQEAQAALDVLRRNRQDYILPTDYYDGRHRLLFASDRFRNVFGNMFAAFADNFCAPVIDIQAERLAIRRFSSTFDGGAEDVAAAAGLWEFNRLGSMYQQAHRDALVTKDAYLIVWPDSAGIPIFHLNPPRNVAVVYDAEIPWMISRAIKVWKETRDAREYARMTLYYPDRVERYEKRTDVPGFPSSVKGFVPVEDSPVVPNPWGRCPVFHLVNRGGPGRSGRSEIAGAIPINDAINKTLADMLVASEYVAYPQRFATGVAEERDANGRPIPPFQVGTERLLTTENPDAKIGQLDAGSFDSPLALMHAFVSHIAVTTGTPPHAFYLGTTGKDWPSGEALKTAEARLIAKCDAAARAWGPVWADAMTLAVRMVRGKNASGAPLATEWEPFAARSEREEMEIAIMKKQIGLSNRRIQQELGYTDDEINAIEAEANEERARAREASGSAFDAL